MGIVMECKNVTYRYPVARYDSLRHINVQIEEGKIYGVIGENGSGKSTFCLLLRGFVPQFYKGRLDGKIFFRDRELQDYGESIAKYIGYIFQDPFTQISGIKDTVFEEVAYGLENFGLPIGDIEDRVNKALQVTNILDIYKRKPTELSGGQLQRVAFASILALDPDVYIIDEPTSQLDPQEASRIFEIIKYLKSKNKTIILVEHKLDLIAQYADYILDFHNGEVIRQGKIRDVLDDTSLLKQGIDLPQALLLAKQLQKVGFEFPTLPITNTELIDMVRRITGRG